MARRFFHIIGLLLAVLPMARLQAAVPIPPHEFHVAITEIVYNPATKALEITTKIFSDDIERSIKALGGGELRLGDGAEAGNADRLLQDYLQNRLSIEVDGRPARFTWVGKEVELDAVWCYVEITGVERFSTLVVTNRILTELFEDQANVVHVQAYGENKSLFLSKESLSGTVGF